MTKDEPTIGIFSFFQTCFRLKLFLLLLKITEKYLFLSNCESIRILLIDDVELQLN